MVCSDGESWSFSGPKSVTLSGLVWTQTIVLYFSVTIWQLFCSRPFVMGNLQFVKMRCEQLKISVNLQCCFGPVRICIGYWCVVGWKSCVHLRWGDVCESVPHHTRSLVRVHTLSWRYVNLTSQRLLFFAVTCHLENLWCLWVLWMAGLIRELQS